MSSEGGTKAIVAAFAANLGIAVSKLVAFALTGAASMLAEGIHSLADSGNQGLLLLGGRRARKRPTEQHPFGFARERYFWAFVVALVLFSVGGLFAIYEGVDKVRHPHALESPTVAYVVLGVAVLLEGLSLRTAVREVAHERRPGDSYARFVRRSKSPELPIVLLEDTGALLGLLFALAGLATAQLTGEPRWDAVGSIAIGLLLVGIAGVLAVEMKSLLIGEAADPVVIEQLTSSILATPGIAGLIHLRTLQLGPEDLLVTAKVEPHDSDLATLADVIDDAEARMRSVVPSARLIFLEPDLRDPAPSA